MKLIFCISGVLAGALGAEISSQSAKSFLRVRREANDDPNVFNYREDFEHFKDRLENLELDEQEAAVDLLENCVAECRAEDYVPWKRSFSEIKADFDEGKGVRPIPCDAYEKRPSCCTKIPAFIYGANFDRADIMATEKQKAKNDNSGFIEMFNTCVGPLCGAGTHAGNPESGKCTPCEAGTYSNELGNRRCTECGENTYSGVRATSCQACEAGTHSGTGAARCDDNECTCDYGSAATGEDCHTNGAAICADCDSDGYYLSGDECIENECTCNNGEGTTGEDCSSDGEESCVEGSCVNDQVWADGLCVAPECECENGDAHTDECYTGAEGCQSCYSGFYTRGNECYEKECSCDGGQGSTGDDCANHGDEYCASCFSSHDYDRGTCTEKVCVCDNGTPTTGDDCPSTGLVNCMAGSCAESFEMKGVNCASMLPDQYSLRLDGGGACSNGNDCIEGRLEMFFQNQWGTVCNDDFEQLDAEVACQQMGYANAQVISAKSSAQKFGTSTGRIWLDNVNCVTSNYVNGDNLADCRRGRKTALHISRGIGNHNCGHIEDIGARCWN